MILFLPIALFWPLGSPAADGVFLRYVTPGLHVSDAALVILLVGFMWGHQDRRWGPIEVTLILSALVFLGFVATGTAIEPRLALYSAGRWLLALAVYFAFRQQRAPLERLVCLFLATLGLQAMVGLLQVLAQGPIGLPGEMALPLTQPGAAIVRLEDGNWLRAYGLTFHPNVLGGYLAVGILLSAPLLHRRRVQLLWWLLFLGLFLSFSRSAWLATGLVLPLVLIWLIWRHPERRRPLGIAIVGATAVILFSAYAWRAPLLVRMQPFLPSAGEESIAQDQPATAPAFPAGQPLGKGTATVTDARIDPILSRLEQIEMALRVVRARPWRGAGAGNFSLVMLLNEEEAIPQPVHNVLLLLAAEVGIFGAGLWLALALNAFLVLASSWRHAHAWTVATIAAWLALVIISFFDFYPWGLNSGRLLSVVVLGLVARMWTESR